MQFTVLAYDHTDAEALDRRMAARPAHITMCDELVQQGNMLVGAALLDEGRMVGSMLVVDFPTRTAVDEWLAKEPYVLGNVWDKIEVIACQIGPSFTHLTTK